MRTILLVAFGAVDNVPDYASYGDPLIVALDRELKPYGLHVESWGAGTRWGLCPPDRPYDWYRTNPTYRTLPDALLAALPKLLETQDDTTLPRGGNGSEREPQKNV